MATKTRTLTSRKGASLETTLRDAEAIDVLQRQQHSSTFAQSLVRQYARYSHLSTEQWFHAHKMALAALAPPEQPAPNVPTLTGIAALFAHAGERLKRPTVFFNMPEGDLCLRRASENGRYVGHTMVSSDTRGGQGTYYGRIDVEGAWWPARQAPPEWVAGALAEMNADPASFTAEYGKRTGACCFCRRELSTAESLAVGYGPVCADKFGLPWGETTSEQYVAASHEDAGPEEDDADPDAEWPWEGTPDTVHDYIAIEDDGITTWIVLLGGTELWMFDSFDPEAAAPLDVKGSPALWFSQAAAPVLAARLPAVAAPTPRRKRRG